MITTALIGNILTGCLFAGLYTEVACRFRAAGKEAGWP